MKQVVMMNRLASLACAASLLIAGIGAVPVRADPDAWEPPYLGQGAQTGCSRDRGAECEMQAHADRVTGDLQGVVRAVAPFEGRVPGHSAAWAMSSITHRHDVTASATDLSYEIDILLRSVEVAHTGLLTNTVGEPFGGVAGVQFDIRVRHQDCGCSDSEVVTVLRSNDDGAASIEDQQITIGVTLVAPQSGIPAGSVDVSVALLAVVNIEGVTPDTGDALAAASVTVTSIRLI